MIIRRTERKGKDGTVKRRNETDWLKRIIWNKCNLIWTKIMRQNIVAESGSRYPEQSYPKLSGVTRLGACETERSRLCDEDRHYLSLEGREVPIEVREAGVLVPAH